MAEVLHIHCESLCLLFQIAPAEPDATLLDFQANAQEQVTNQELEPGSYEFVATLVRSENSA